MWGDVDAGEVFDVEDGEGDGGGDGVDEEEFGDWGVG